MGRAELRGCFVFRDDARRPHCCESARRPAELGLKTSCHASLQSPSHSSGCTQGALLTPLAFCLAGRFSIDRSNAAQRIARCWDRCDRRVLRRSVEFFARPDGSPARFPSGGLGGPYGPRGGFFSILRGPMILNHFIIHRSPLGGLRAGLFPALSGAER